ncbi:TetR/AcrR family transcriptional regulator [Devosia sp. A449]
MGRRQTIDRGALLDAAERVVLRDGANGLTMDAVAREAGVSKGGVLYAFTTKDTLIDEMMRRVTATYDALVEQFLAIAADGPKAHFAAHVMASSQEDEAAQARAVALMASFVRSPNFQQESRAYYQSLFDRLDLSAEVGRKARLALLATEGAFMLRGFGFYPFGAEEWRVIHEDIIAILLS